MLRKIVTVVIVVPLVVIIVAFAVANRQAVTISFDPLSSTDPAYAATLPLFMVIFVVLIVGVTFGGVAAWIGQSRWRRAARSLDAEMRSLRAELETIRRDFGTRPPDQPVARSEPLPVIPPPIP